MNTVRWNVAVSPDVDQSVRMFIAAQGGGRKGDEGKGREGGDAGEHGARSE